MEIWLRTVYGEKSAEGNGIAGGGRSNKNMEQDMKREEGNTTLSELCHRDKQLEYTSLP